VRIQYRYHYQSLNRSIRHKRCGYSIESIVRRHKRCVSSSDTTMARSTRSTNTRQKLETGVDSTTVTLSDAATIISGVIPRISRASRNCKPRCLHFAPSRAEFENKYPDHFFCTECDSLYQTWVVIGAEPRNSVNCRKYLCSATHDNFIRPSQLKPVSHYLIRRVPAHSDFFNNTPRRCAIAQNL
jgi:hypothetical protein